MTQGMGNFKFPERLRQLELPTLAYRRNRGDMIVTYKLLSGTMSQLDMATVRHHTRSNSRKLTVMICRFDLQKYCFTNRIVNMWNNLPHNVILADNVNQFKNRLDKRTLNPTIPYYTISTGKCMRLYLFIAPTLLKPQTLNPLTLTPIP